jgi:protoporphyrinogen/coproporphyrinogen III oxidase
VIGTLDTTNLEVTIVGAGVSGMLMAYALDKQGYTVTLLERESRSGGLIQTRRTEYGMAEAAAHSLLASNAVTELCRELGVELVEVRKDSRSRFIVRDGRPSKFPLHVGEVASTFSRALFARSENGLGGLSLEEWARRHLGEAALQYLLTPFVRGIYGAQPEEIGVAAAFPMLAVPHGQTLLGAMLRKSFKRSPSKNGSKKESSKRMVAPKEGMGYLIERLEKHLEERLGNRFRKGVNLESLPDAPNLVVTVPAFVAAELLEREAPALSSRLREVRYTPIVSVTAFVSRDSFTRPISGVGALVPACEGRKCLGILFNSSSFENRVVDESRYASFTILLGGSADPARISATDEEIREIVREELSSLLGIKAEPMELIINRWPRAIPQYSTRLPEVWKAARETWCSQPGRILFGNYTGQVSLRGMIETVASLG